MKSLRFGRLLLLIGLFLFPFSASATTVLNVPLDQMTRESQVILHGRVQAQQVVQEGGTDRILTLTAIEVLTPVKGVKKGDELTIYQVGGTLDGQTLKVIGALKFREGEEFVLFGVRFRDMIVSYGMGLGKYALAERDGQKVVAAEYGDVQRVERTPDGKLKPAAPDTSKPEALDAFINRVKALAGVEGGAQ